MKKTIFFLITLFIVTVVFSQTDSVQAPYKRSPFLPQVKLLLPDSVTYFTNNDLKRKTPVMIMLFHPQCEHCRHETEELVQNIGKFEDIQIIMTTSMHFDSMMAFRDKYQLAKYKNIIVAQDIHFSLISFFAVRNLPFLAFYNKKQELISAFEGGLPVVKILEEFEKN